jgi:hypothetical protein
MVYSVLSLSRRIGRDTLGRLIKPTVDNLLGVLAGALGVLGSARSHNWSRQAIWANAWETLMLPWGLVLCGLFFIHTCQSARVVYKEESVAFKNALGGITMQPPRRFVWRYYLIVVTFLCLPTVIAYFIWNKNNLEPPPVAALPPVAEPLLYVQPDTAIRNDKGSFLLHLQNSGPDIDYVGVDYDYFVAKKKDNKIVIYRTVHFQDAPSPNIRPLKTNQAKLVTLNFSGYTTAIYNSLAESQYGYVLEGVRLIVTFRRYSDDKRYRQIWSYVCNRGDCNFVYAPGTSFDQSGPPGTSFLSFNDIVPYMESNEHWEDPVVQVPPTKVVGGNPIH